MLPSVVEDPPKEDSLDLTDEEVLGAIPSRNIAEVLAELKLRVVPGPFTHELRRRTSLFWRIRSEAEVLVFHVPWLEV